MKLAEKVAIVTGTSPNIGGGIAQKLEHAATAVKLGGNVAGGVGTSELAYGTNVVQGEQSLSPQGAAITGGFGAAGGLADFGVGEVLDHFEFKN
jgi:NAD(P)-dependent dehydrogenase (short-subunit alcohol dehydrogenase family)